MSEIHLGPEDRQAIYDAIRSAMMNDPQMRQAVYTGTLDAIKTVHTEALEAEIAELRKVLAWFRNGNRELPIERDELGRMVREAWVRWAESQSQPKPRWLIPYHKLNEPDKEADRQIGEAIARWTLVFAAGEKLPEFADEAQRQGGK